MLARVTRSSRNGMVLSTTTSRQAEQLSTSSSDSVLCPSFCRCVRLLQTNAGLRMPGVFVVHLDWLVNSVWHCRRESEVLFLLTAVRPYCTVPCRTGGVAASRQSVTPSFDVGIDS